MSDIASNSLDLHAALQTAESIARQAGMILLQYYERPRQASHKSTVIDLVTEADKASENFIVESLRAPFPIITSSGRRAAATVPRRRDALSLVHRPARRDDQFRAPLPGVFGRVVAV